MFDEIEKAHPGVFNVLLQVLDDGRITDAQGRTVDFKNTVIIMTSNIGPRYLLEGVQGDSIPDGMRESGMAELRKSFRPGVPNRVDETILFKPLAETGYDPVFGAQPLKHYLQRNLETKLARALIAGEVGEGAANYLHRSG